MSSNMAPFSNTTKPVLSFLGGNRTPLSSLKINVLFTLYARINISKKHALYHYLAADGLGVHLQVRGDCGDGVLDLEEVTLHLGRVRVRVTVTVTVRVTVKVRVRARVRASAKVRANPNPGLTLTPG